MFFFFFFKQKTAYEMRISDWSSDVCSSDLYLLQLLNRFRPKRPLDGIILTLPCDELISSKRLNHNEIYERAKVIYTKLWELQSILGIKVPVYVVLTKSEDRKSVV